MRNFILVGLVFLFLYSCKKDEVEDVICDNAQINLCNNTTDKIFVYGFNINQVTDTLFPGECDLRNMGQLTIKFHSDGSLKESNSGSTFLYNPYGASAFLGVTSCYWEYNPPTGYLDISHCYNGVFDPREREFDTDCGGNCVPCGNINVNCSNLILDEFSLSNQSSSFSLASVYDKNEINNKTILEFTFYNGEILNISMPHSEIPISDKRLITGSEFWESDVWFTDRNGFNMYTAIDGSSLFIKAEANNKKSIQFCDIDFARNNSIVQGSGYLTIN